VLGSVLALPGVRSTPVLRDRAAHLAVPGSVIAGPSAARLWGLAVPDGEPYLIVNPQHHPRVPGIRFLRIKLDRRDVQSFEGAAVTSKERTVVDCLRLLPDAAAMDLLDRALQRRLISVDGLVERVLLLAGRPGAQTRVRLVRLISGGARSAMERLAAQLLNRAGITGWSANRQIRDGHGVIGLGDLVFDDVRLVIELDSWAFHVTPDRFQGDRRRQNRLVAAGWTILRFTWRDLTERPDYVVTTIRAALGRLGLPARSRSQLPVQK